MINDRYIPVGALKISDKNSDAVAYIYTNAKDKPCARVFFGKQSKPVSHYSFRTPADREKHVREMFEARAARQGAKAKDRAEKTAWQNPYEVGDVFCQSGGWEQTNVTYYQVVASKGKTLTLRKICQERTYTQSMAGQTFPLVGEFVGAEITCRAQPNGIKVERHGHAHYEKPQVIAGNKVYSGQYFSEYA